MLDLNVPIDDSHRLRFSPSGMEVVKIGGPVYRIGVGGGAASSVQVWTAQLMTGSFVLVLPNMWEQVFALRSKGTTAVSGIWAPSREEMLRWSRR